MKYHIRIYGDPVLREASRPVEKVDDEIRRLAEDMTGTMHENRGAGLAAQQIGRTESICVIDVDTYPEEAGDAGEDHGIEMPLVLINPKIIEHSGSQTGQEGCLSFPDVYVELTRWNDILVEYTDIQGELKRLSLKGLPSRAVQHELDHLNGVLLVDHMTPVQKVAVGGKLKRMKKRAMAV